MNCSNLLRKDLEKFENLIEKINIAQSAPNPNHQWKEGVNPKFDFEKYYKDFEAAMDDDLNTPQAVAVLFDFVRDVNKTIAENENLARDFILSVKEFLSKTAQGVLGIVDLEKSEIPGKLY